MNKPRTIKGLPLPKKLTELLDHGNLAELFSDKLSLVIPFLVEPMIFLAWNDDCGKNYP